jgi:hypothetical protein
MQPQARIVPLTITREQRDAIYEVVMNHLTAIGDVWLAVDRGDFEEASRVGRDFAEDLRLLADLGWEQEIDREKVTLTMPRSELARALVRLHERANGSLGSYVSRPKEDEELAERDVAAAAALAELLGKLAGTTS